LRHRAASDQRGPAPPASDALRQGTRLAPLQHDSIGRDAELFGDEAPDERLVSLPVDVSPQPGPDLPVPDGHAGALARRRGGDEDEAGEADSLLPSPPTVSELADRGVEEGLERGDLQAGPGVPRPGARGPESNGHRGPT